MTRVLVLGATGMLGCMVQRVLDRNPDIEAVPATRDGEQGSVTFDAGSDSVEELVADGGYDWIVNAIGLIGPRIDERNPASVARAIDINASFPHRLATALGGRQRVMQIATDAVFRGDSAPYVESDPHDASAVYARTKSLGEVASPGFINLRCSIVGPERPPPSSLLGWLLSQPWGARISGYTNHRWNGVTTWHFARLCEAVIRGEIGDLPSSLHVVPGDSVTKAELLELSLDAFGRTDLSLTPQPAETAVDRRLSTNHPEINRRLWSAAGYPNPPPIGQMVRELAAGHAGSPARGE